MGVGVVLQKIQKENEQTNESGRGLICKSYVLFLEAREIYCTAGIGYLIRPGNGRSSSFSHAAGRSLPTMMLVHTPLTCVESRGRG